MLMSSDAQSGRVTAESLADMLLGPLEDDLGQAHKSLWVGLATRRVERGSAHHQAAPRSVAAVTTRSLLIGRARLDRFPLRRPDPPPRR
jgi:hypothetical protein